MNRAAHRVVAEELSVERQAEVVARLQRTLASRQRRPVTRIETHISFVLVCGDHAYKIKKALRTPFLDQSTLALRQRACRDELRLNRRLAPDLYLAVVPVTGSAESPQLDGAGANIDVAVQMRAFSQDGLWDQLAAQGALTASHIDALAHTLAAFHASAAVADAGGPFGTPAQVRAPLLQSLDEIEALDDDGRIRGFVQRLQAWEAKAFARLAPVMALRLAHGRVREGHGDLHLGNVTEIDGRTTVFDCIDFNDDFRWIDVMSDLAFMAMDLQAHGLPHLAYRLVNGYLEQCGDYDGMPMLNYYRVHRSVVRAKVRLLRAAQNDRSDEAAASEDRDAAARYLELAVRISGLERSRPVLMISHGFSGSGKSTLTQALLEAAGAVRIRADVERKRLAGLATLARQGPRLYSAEMTNATYAAMVELAQPVLEAGCHAILDATFLVRAHRDAVRQLGQRLGVPFVILDFDVEADVLRRRLRERAAQNTDPSDADEVVLAAQMLKAEPLAPDEAAQVVHVPASSLSLQDVESSSVWRGLLQQLDSRPPAACRPPSEVKLTTPERC